MRDISERIIQKIQDDHIQPTPKWHFQLRNSIFWAVFLVSILVGAISFSVILHFLSVNDWDVYPYLGKNLPEFIAFVMPYFWILFLFLFLGLAYYDYRHTKGAYKFRGYAVFAASLFMSLVLGLYFFYTGIASETDKVMNKNLTFYEGSREMVDRVWHQPEIGMVAGTVVENVAAEDVSAPSTEAIPVEQPTGQILVKDCEGNIWKVNKEEDKKKVKDDDDDNKKENDDEKKNDSKKPAVAEKPVARRVKVIGVRSTDCDNCIDAKEVRDWHDDDDDDDDDNERDDDDDDRDEDRDERDED